MHQVIAKFLNLPGAYGLPVACLFFLLVEGVDKLRFYHEKFGAARVQQMLPMMTKVFLLNLKLALSQFRYHFRPGRLPVTKLVTSYMKLLITAVISCK